MEDAPNLSESGAKTATDRYCSVQLTKEQMGRIRYLLLQFEARTDLWVLDLVESYLKAHAQNEATRERGVSFEALRETMSPRERREVEQRGTEARLCREMLALTECVVRRAPTNDSEDSGIKGYSDVALTVGQLVAIREVANERRGDLSRDDSRFWTELSVICDAYLPADCGWDDIRDIAWYTSEDADQIWDRYVEDQKRRRKPAFSGN